MAGLMTLRGKIPVTKQPGIGGQPAPNPSNAPAGCSTQSATARRQLVKPFALSSYASIAAGAQAINTDLFDMFDAANVDFIATDNVFPYDVETFGICTLISGNLAATYTEVLAWIAGLYWVESDQTGELARWPGLSLGLIYGLSGVVTSGAAATAFQFGPESFEEWKRYYPNGSTQSLALRTTTAVTTTAAMGVGGTFVAKR